MMERAIEVYYETRLATNDERSLENPRDRASCMKGAGIPAVVRVQ
jgi:hypothetical protein